MANTLLLALNTWDLTVDASGNIAMASEPYSIAQDVASQCRLFLGELWYDTSQGIPYLERIFGKLPPAQFIKQQLIAAAMMVPEVISAKVFFTSFTARALGGQMQVVTTFGTLLVTTADFLSNAPWYISAASPQAASSLTGGP